jgi:hypothetical protein
MTKISDLQSTEVMRELLDLADEAAEHERWMLYLLVTGRNLPVVARAELRDAYGSIPDDERRMQLATARRLIAIGMRQYGPLDPQRDGRDYDAETVAELVDCSVYLLAHLRRSNKSHPLERESVDLMRRAVAMALRSESI